MLIKLSIRGLPKPKRKFKDKGRKTKYENINPANSKNKLEKNIKKNLFFSLLLKAGKINPISNQIQIGDEIITAAKKEALIIDINASCTLKK
jgi:hypothetical protein